MERDILAKAVEEKKFQIGTVGLVSLSHLIHDIYTAFLAPILPILIDKLQFSYSMAGILILLVRIPAIFSPWIGMVADKMSPKYLVIVTPALTAISMSFIGNANSYWSLCILLLIAGMSSAVYHVPSPVMIKYVSGDRTGAGMSFYMMGGELARTIGPLLILAGVSYWGLEGSWRLVFLGLAASLLLYFKIRKIPIHEDLKNQKTDPLLNIFRKHKKVFIISGALVCTKSFMILALTSFLPTYMTSKGSSLWFAGAALSILELAGAAGTLLSGSISDFIGRRNMLLIVTLAAPVILIIFVYTSGWLLFPVLIILGLLVFSFSPVLMAYVLDSVHEYPSTANSIFMALNFGLGSLVAIFFGVLGDLISLDTTYIISALLSLIGLPFIFKMPKNGDEKIK